MRLSTTRALTSQVHKDGVLTAAKGRVVVNERVRIDAKKIGRTAELQYKRVLPPTSPGP
jgi:hypothetical protein